MIKSIVRFFLDHKSLNHLLFLVLLLLSFFSYEKVAKEMFPPTALDNVVISGGYRSSSADVLDQLIVRDCEKILKDNPNLTNISSVIGKGRFHVTAEIMAGSTNLIVSDISNDIASLDVDLPENMKLPTVSTVEQFFPLISLAIFPKDDNKSKIVEISKSLKDEIGGLKHIYKSELVGKFDKSLRVILDYDKIEAFGLDKDKVIRALEGLYLMYPVGTIKGKKEKFYVSTKSSNIKKDEILDTYLNIDGKNVYIKEIATVKIKYEKHSLLTRTDAKKSFMIMTKKAKRGDAIKLSKQIREIVQRYSDQYPHINFKIIDDSSFWIKTRLNVISANILIGLILLFFAIWLFISFKVTLVVAIGIPVSIAFGIIGLDVTGSSLNTLSMIGVLLSLGMLVDEAIVVSENIHRHRQMGKSVYNACIDGTAEVIPVLFIALLTTIIAFLPLTVLSGGMGAFIKIIPIMVMILIASSFLESFVFLPTHYAFINRDKKETKKSIREKFWKRIIDLYRKFLHFILRFKYIVLIAFVLLSFLFSFLLFKQSKFVLFPEFDAMSINITGKLKGNSLSLTSKESKKLELAILEAVQNDDVSSVHSTIGMLSDGRSKHEMSNNFFTITIYLKPKITDDYFNSVINPIFHLFGQNVGEKRTRTKTAKEILHGLDDILQKHRASKNIMEINAKVPQTGVVKDDISLLVSAPSDDEIKDAITLLKSTMKSIDGVYNIKDDMDYNDIDLVIDINAYGKSLGFTQGIMIAVLRKYLSLKEVSKMSNGDNELLKLKLKTLNKNSLENLKNLKLKVPSTSELVKLKDITNINMKRKISTIKKENMKKVFRITASLEKSKLTSRVFNEKLEATFEELKSNGIIVGIKGEAGKNKEIQADMIKSLLFALLGILLVLTWYFNSFWLAIFSLSVIPLSAFGVLLGHKLVGLPLTFSTLLGFVGLIGVVMNDTLMMLGFINKSKNLDELSLFASRRLRPIFLTSITTILGLFTLIFFASGESLLMQPLAVSIGFGLLWATVINLLYVPLGYALTKNK